MAWWPLGKPIGAIDSLRRSRHVGFEYRCCYEFTNSADIPFVRATSQSRPRGLDQRCRRAKRKRHGKIQSQQPRQPDRHQSLKRSMDISAPAPFRIRAAEPRDVPDLMRLKRLLAE